MHVLDTRPPGSVWTVQHGTVLPGQMEAPVSGQPCVWGKGGGHLPRTRPNRMRPVLPAAPHSLAPAPVHTISTPQEQLGS